MELAKGTQGLNHLLRSLVHTPVHKFISVNLIFIWQ